MSRRLLLAIPPPAPIRASALRSAVAELGVVRQLRQFPMKATYVRFVVGTNREPPQEQTGVVASLRILKEAGYLPDYEAQHVDELFEWLNTHLPCPPFSQKKWSPQAISWFKASAHVMISKFRELVSILEQHDQPVRMLTTFQPGMILYEDDYQVVAQSKHF